jgi:hypothetical protein
MTIMTSQSLQVNALKRSLVAKRSLVTKRPLQQRYSESLSIPAATKRRSNFHWANVPGLQETVDRTAPGLRVVGHWPEVIAAAAAFGRQSARRSIQTGRTTARIAPCQLQPVRIWIEDLWVPGVFFSSCVFVRACWLRSIVFATRCLTCFSLAQQMPCEWLASRALEPCHPGRIATPIPGETVPAQW